MAEPARKSYPRKVEIERAVKAAVACGIRIGAVRLGPGTIEIVQADAIKQTDFDRWEAEL
jgi:hypothetical protein